MNRAENRLFSIVVPTYQNESNIHDTVDALLGLQVLLPEYRIELVFVDDGSTDGSMELLCLEAKRHPNVLRIVKLTRNFGQTPATQAGLRHASGHCVGVISADLQEPPEAFVEMIRQWERGAKFVIGARETREEGWWHTKVSGIYQGAIRKFVFRDYPELGYDFCLLDRQIVEDLNRINEKNSSIFVLIYWLGFRPTLVPITRRLRVKGASQWSLWKKIKLTIDSLIGFTYLPARFITALGFATAILCLSYFGFALINWLRYKMAPPGWMTVIGFLAFLGAMILFSIGIVSEYLLRILDEARKRPLYVVDRIIDKAENLRPSGGRPD